MQLWYEGNKKWEKVLQAEITKTDFYIPNSIRSSLQVLRSGLDAFLFSLHRTAWQGSSILQLRKETTEDNTGFPVGIVGHKLRCLWLLESQELKLKKTELGLSSESSKHFCSFYNPVPLSGSSRVCVCLTLNFYQNGFESSSALGSFRVLMWKPKTLGAQPMNSQVLGGSQVMLRELPSILTQGWCHCWNPNWSFLNSLWWAGIPFRKWGFGRLRDVGGS